MAIRGLTLSATLTYVSPRDPAKGSTEETRFVLGPLDVMVAAQVFDSSLEFRAGDAATQVHLNRMNIEAVRFGLRDLQNFQDAAGNVLPFATQDRLVAGRVYKVVTDEILRQIPMEEIRDMAEQIRGLSTVTAAEAGN